MQELSAILPKATESDLPLSDLRKQYIGKQFSKKDFEERICRFLLENYQRFHLFDRDKDAFTDYLCWLYPRLSRAIDAYQEVGSSFDAYIGSLVSWSSKEYRSRASDRYTIERAWWETHAKEELFASEYTPAYLADERFEPVEPVKKNRQVLILLLKSYFFLSDDFVARVAPALGLSFNKLMCMIEQLHKLRRKREDKIFALQEKLTSQYYRCVVYERQLKFLPERAARRETIRERLARAQMRYANTKQRLVSINRTASNSQIAQVLGIPKGTVDSSLYTIKHKAMPSR